MRLMSTTRSWRDFVFRTWFLAPILAVAMASPRAAFADPLPDSPATVVRVHKGSLEAQDGKQYEVGQGNFLNLDASMKLADAIQKRDEEIAKLRKNNEELAGASVPAVVVITTILLSFAAGAAVMHFAR